MRQTSRDLMEYWTPGVAPPRSRDEDAGLTRHDIKTLQDPIPKVPVNVYEFVTNFLGKKEWWIGVDLTDKKRLGDLVNNIHLEIDSASNAYQALLNFAVSRKRKTKNRERLNQKIETLQEQIRKLDHMKQNLEASVYAAVETLNRVAANGRTHILS